MSIIEKEIPGFEDKYIAHTDGRIFSIRSNKYLKPIIRCRGYLAVDLGRKGGRHSIHRLVARTFLENYSEDLVVNHLDGNKTNNQLSNLEMCTNAENLQHSYRVGLHNNKGERSGRAIMRAKDVKEARKLYITGNYTQKILGEMYGVERSTMRSALVGISWKEI